VVEEDGCWLEPASEADTGIEEIGITAKRLHLRTEVVNTIYERKNCQVARK
jgi:hypothetical protein